MQHKCPNCGYEPEPISFEDALTLRFMAELAAPLTADPKLQEEYSKRMRYMIENYQPKENP